MNDPVTTRVDSPLQSAVETLSHSRETLTEETFRLWRNELEGFLASTQQRLKSLATAISAEGGASREDEQIVVADAAKFTPRVPPAAAPVPPPMRPEAVSDPLHRLSAIKQRLAQQLERS
jgi:hypothetical protein